MIHACWKHRKIPRGGDRTHDKNAENLDIPHVSESGARPELRFDPDLQVLIAAWQTLPEHIRETIKTLIQSTGK